MTMTKKQRITNNKMLRFTLCWLLFFAATSQAHQQKAAFTQVLLNPNTGMLEVAHRFWLHDAEHAVQTLFGSGHNIIADDASRQQFADYVMQKFDVFDAQGHQLALNYVGNEIERSFIWIYQESQPPATFETLTIYHAALLDIWPDQENMVNVEGIGELQTIYLNHQRTTDHITFGKASQ